MFPRLGAVVVFLFGLTFYPSGVWFGGNSKPSVLEVGNFVFRALFGTPAFYSWSLYHMFSTSIYAASNLAKIFDGGRWSCNLRSDVFDRSFHCDGNFRHWFTMLSINFMPPNQIR